MVGAAGGSPPRPIPLPGPEPWGWERAEAPGEGLRPMEAGSLDPLMCTPPAPHGCIPQSCRPPHPRPLPWLCVTHAVLLELPLLRPCLPSAIGPAGRASRGAQAAASQPAPPAPSPVTLSPDGDAATRRDTAGPQIHGETSVLPFPLHMHQAGDSLPSQVPVPSRINISVGTSLPTRQRGGWGGGVRGGFSVCPTGGEDRVCLRSRQERQAEQLTPFN